MKPNCNDGEIASHIYFKPDYRQPISKDNIEQTPIAVSIASPPPKSHKIINE